MGPCVTCGQLTEPDAAFCPACAGYAAPATVYSYAPGRFSHTDDELAQILVPLARPRESAQDQRPDAPTEDWRPPERRSRHPGRTRLRLGAGRRRWREGRWLVAAAALIVLIIAAGAVLLDLSHPRLASSAQHRPTASASAPTPSPTVPPSSPGPQVSVGPQAASSPNEPVVLSFLTSYFGAINDHDFTAYEQLFSPPLRADLSAPAFSAGYETTTDSAITLTDIAVIGSGELVAQVTFVSHQQPAASPTNSACTSWSVSLYLLPQDGSYMLQQPPAGYQASYTACA
jgi:hypothetical protein